MVLGVEAESKAILRKADDDGCSEGGFGGEGEVDLGKGARVGLQLGQDVKQGGAQDCEEESDWGEVKDVRNGNRLPMKPREWAALKGSDVGSAMVDRCCGCEVGEL